MTTVPAPLRPFFERLNLPAPDSHKGQNGKLMIIGGSDLFHAASRWSLDIASHFVDMVFYSSVPSNNDLMQEAKGEFWNGIVIKREDLESYVEEADCILIGPGMTRSTETAELTDSLVKKYPDKKWVIDAGALQMISPALLNEKIVITPHPKEFAMVLGNLHKGNTEIDEADQREWQLHIQEATPEQLQKWAKELGGPTIVLKGKVDQIFTSGKHLPIEGGHPGMTKGGTGDVLAGLIAALVCTNDLLTASVVGSVTNKAAGEKLAETYGPFFNATELITAIPQTLWSLHQSVREV
jgi:hydroxyethylthiazole kinase-like uncharacterized protein yjeF